MEQSSLNPQPKELTRSAKYILPLLFKYDEIITNGFDNVYTEDINRPWLENKIFITYEYQYERGAMHKVVSEHPDFYDRYWTTIDGITYSVYVFNQNPELRTVYKMILNGMASGLTDERKKTIIQFWPIYLTEIMGRDRYLPIKDTIPAEDAVEYDVDVLLGIA